MSSSRIWFITGANSGLGLEVVKKVLAEGDKVIAAIRTPSKFPNELKGPNVHILQLDVSAAQDKINKLVEEAYSHFGRIDVVHNNAGYIQMGAIEETSYLTQITSTNGTNTDTTSATKKSKPNTT